MSDAATSTTTTPNNMPGATATVTTPATTAAPETATTTTVTPAAAASTASLGTEERAELERLREVHKDEQKWRREATALHGPAEAYKKLLEGLGVDPAKPDAKDFDAKSAFAELNSKFESEQSARIRETVARTEGVEPEDFSGTTEEEMRASAKRFKARIEAEVEKRGKTVQTAAASAAEVSSNGKVEGPKPIKSRDELQKMSRAERIEAHKAGRLDDLAAGRT